MTMMETSHDAEIAGLKPRFGFDFVKCRGVCAHSFPRCSHSIPLDDVVQVSCYTSVLLRFAV